jgi:hypothetical protein
MYRDVCTHAVSSVRTQVTDWIIRDRREMDDGVETFDLLRGHIANITGPLFVAVRLSAKIATVVPTNIKADNLVAGGLHKRNEYRTDVATVPILSPCSSPKAA